MHPTTRTRRSALVLTLALLASVLSAVGAIAPTPAPAAAQGPPAVTGEACGPGVGVTVVVDHQQLGGGIEIGCAPGEQADGFDALTNAGFTFNEDPGALGGTICQIRQQPAQGYPYCWYEGFWGYWKSDGAEPWQWSQVGAGDGPLAVDRVEGWSWTSPIPPDFSGAPMGIAVEDLADHVPADGTAPVITVTSAPSGVVVEDHAEIAFTVDEPAEVEYRLDDGGWQPAASPIGLTDLPGGLRTVEIRATDPAGNVGRTVVSWVVFGPRICAFGPELPALDVIDAREVLPVRQGDGYDVEVAVLTDLDADPATAEYDLATEVPLADHEGREVRVLARVAEDTCEGAPTFDATYDVRSAYSPRATDTSDPANLSPAVHRDDDRIVAWATGHSDYVVGAGVDPQWRTPENAYGPPADANTVVVVLGDHGSITLTFDEPVADGDGYDLAVYENGFAITGSDRDFLELGYVEVSSNGTDFVRFDTATRQETPVAGFQGQRADLVGGVAGKDLHHHGTPFDLALLRNTHEVRSGVVDLDRITHVRIVDIVGDGGDLDGFGRPIYDAYPTVGSAGFDLTAVAVLNQAEPRTADESWAVAAHTDLLGRAPTGAELAATVARLDAGTSRATVAGELSTGDEWITGIVTRFFGDTLDREPDAGGLAYWVGEIRSGRRTVAQVASQFYASSEYYRVIGGGTATSWVTDLYVKLLHREPDADGLAFWVQRTTTRGREHVAGSLYGSPEARRDRVDALYRALLGRDADPAGRSYWAGRIEVEGDLALAVHLVVSDEYRDRARTRFP